MLTALQTPNIIVSVSGPSKSGKSVLLQRAIGKDYLIRIFGPQIESAGDLWSAVLDWMESPTSTTEQTSQTSSNGTVVKGNASFSLPGGVLSLGGGTEGSNGPYAGGARDQRFSLCRFR